MEFKVTKSINAKPETIWKHLTNSKAYPTWNKSVNKIEGEIDLGNKIKLFAEGIDRPFSLKVNSLDKSKSMVWQGGMPFGLFKGVRTFSLTTQTDGSTQFEMHEKFSGPLSGLIGKTIPDLNPSLEIFAMGLKKISENKK